MLYFEANRLIYGLLNAQEKAERFLTEIEQDYFELKKQKLEKKYKNPRDLKLAEFEIISLPQYETMNEIRTLYMKIKEKAYLLDRLLKADKDIEK